MNTHPELGSTTWGPLGKLLMGAMPIVVPFLVVGAVIIVGGLIYEISRKAKDRALDARVAKAEAEKASNKPA